MDAILADHTSVAEAIAWITHGTPVIFVN